MLKHQFYHGLIRKYVVIFGNLFKDIHITRKTLDSQTEQLLKVPLSYAPKEKTLTRLFNDPDIDRQYAALLPRMSFEIKNIYYDPQRKLPVVNKYVKKSETSNETALHTFNPVPYNFDIELSIMVKNTVDGTKIVEQILPFFTPDYTVSVELIPELGIVQDIVIEKGNVEILDLYDGDFKKRETLLWNITFTLKGYLYGPVRENKIIKFANVQFYTPTVENLVDAVGVADPKARVSVRPTMLANGSPTSNIALSAPVTEISIDDDFGFGVTIEDPL